MAEGSDSKNGDSAEKAYAAATEALPIVPVEAPAVEFPPKAKRSRKPRPIPMPEIPEAEIIATVPKPAPAAEAPAAAPEPAAPEAIKAPAKPLTAKLVKSRPAVAAKPAKPVARKQKKPIKAKPRSAPRKAAARIAASKPLKPATIKASTIKPKVSPSIQDVTPTALNISQLKDKIMATTAPDFAEGFKTAIADAQEKAKAAFEKGTTAMGEATEFAKGNLEAAVESGKILAAGLQQIGTTYVSEGKSAFETMTADVKELSTAKTPVDFFKLQGDLARRNFDSAVAFGSKNSEAFLKLANEVVAPLSNRVSLAVEKIKKAA